MSSLNWAAHTYPPIFKKPSSNYFGCWPPGAGRDASHIAKMGNPILQGWIVLSLSAEPAIEMEESRAMKPRAIKTVQMVTKTLLPA